MDKAIPIIFFVQGIVSVCNFMFMPVSPLRQSICLMCFWLMGLCAGWLVRKRQVELKLGMAARGMLGHERKDSDERKTVA